MIQRSLSLATSSLIFALGGAMYANCAEVGVVIGVPPPPPKVEVVPVAPVVGYMWRPGYWRWAEGRYVWIPGAYVVPPRPSAVWIPGHWTPGGGGWVWVAGFWRR
jgi:hypothetical protein